MTCYVFEDIKSSKLSLALVSRPEPLKESQLAFSEFLKRTFHEGKNTKILKANLKVSTKNDKNCPGGI